MNQLKYYVHSDSVETNQVVQIYTGKNTRFVTSNPFEFRLEEVEEIYSLNGNWDGYDAVPVFKEVYDTTKTLITVLDAFAIERIHDIFPNPHGTISIEWVSGMDEKLSLEIGINNYSFFIKHIKDKPQFFDGKTILTDIKILTGSIENLFREKIPKFILA